MQFLPFGVVIRQIQALADLIKGPFRAFIPPGFGHRQTVLLECDPKPRYIANVLESFLSFKFVLTVETALLYVGRVD